jgi:hypothetical protein
MKKIFCLVSLLMLCITTHAQSKTLALFNIEQENILRTGMLALGGWAVLNILISSLKLANSTRALKYFYQMNLYWNIANLLIAGAALHFIFSTDAETRILAESIHLHSWYKKVLYLNIGLDLCYVMAGFYLKERSKNLTAHHERQFGWGQSIVLQGCFLFMLDLILVVMLEYRADQLFRLIPNS